MSSNSLDAILSSWDCHPTTLIGLLEVRPPKGRKLALEAVGIPLDEEVVGAAHAMFGALGEGWLEPIEANKRSHAAKQARPGNIDMTRMARRSADMVNGAGL